MTSILERLDCEMYIKMSQLVDNKKIPNKILELE